MAAIDSRGNPTAENPGWVGDFDCSVCRRKRLIAAEFSKAQCAKSRTDPSFKMKCLKCVDNASAELKPVIPASNALFVCAGPCAKDLPAESFTKNQLKKKAGKHKCKNCAEAGDALAASASAGAQAQNLSNLKAKAAAAEKSGTAMEKARALAAVAAAEAEMVTGLKPVVLGRGEPHFQLRHALTSLPPFRLIMPALPFCVLGKGKGKRTSGKGKGR